MTARLTPIPMPALAEFDRPWGAGVIVAVELEIWAVDDAVGVEIVGVERVVEVSVVECVDDVAVEAGGVVDDGRIVPIPEPPT